MAACCANDPVTLHFPIHCHPSYHLFICFMFSEASSFYTISRLAREQQFFVVMRTTYLVYWHGPFILLYHCFLNYKLDMCESTGKSYIRSGSFLASLSCCPLYFLVLNYYHNPLCVQLSFPFLKINQCVIICCGRGLASYI